MALAGPGFRLICKVGTASLAPPSARSTRRPQLDCSHMLRKSDVRQPLSERTPCQKSKNPNNLPGSLGLMHRPVRAALCWDLQHARLLESKLRA